MLVLLLAICASIIGLVAYLRFRKTSTADLVARLPAGDAVILYIDFAALRQAGILELFAGSDMVQEPEYRAFVSESGFDYQRDLDSALVSFHRDGVFFMLRGRFDWSSLNQYTTRQGGLCHNSFCRVAGSTPERKISFFPVEPNLMALAVAKDSWAASLLSARKPDRMQPAIPNQPVWSFIPASVLKKADTLPPGARLFAGVLEGADQIVLSLGPQGYRMELLLDVACHSPQDAAVLASQLEKATSVLRESIARENRQPNPRDLSGLLTGGVFTQQDRRVLGRWPVERVFLEALAGGTR